MGLIQMTQILSWMKANKEAAILAFLGLLTALSVSFGVITYQQNKKLSERLELAQNNIEAYQGALNGSQQAFGVLKLDMTKLSEQNDELIQKIDSVRKESGIKAKDLNTAATQTQTIYVTGSKDIKEDIITVLKDTVYSDTLQYNDLTKIYYNISKDTVVMTLDVKNTQYLYVFKKKEYKNKKSFIKRLFTFDFKKLTKYKYDIVNTNELIKTDSVRIIEKE